MYQYFKGLIRFNENKDAVAAAAWMGSQPHCSHGNIIFADVDISKVLTTFLVFLEARGWKNRAAAFNAPEPLRLCKQALFGENHQQLIP